MFMESFLSTNLAAYKDSSYSRKEDFIRFDDLAQVNNSFPAKTIKEVGYEEKYEHEGGVNDIIACNWK